MFALILVVCVIVLAATVIFALAPCMLSSRISRDEERRDFITSHTKRAA